jgi:peroxiredoxin
MLIPLHHVVAAWLNSTDPTGPDAAGPRVVAGPRDAAPTQPTTAEPPIAEVRVGEPAPDFSYQGADNRWHRLRDLLVQGPVLLVFGAADRELKSLQRERERLLDLGVIVVAVMDVKSSTAHSVMDRLALQYTVLSDPQRAIAAQFNAVDAVTGRHEPCWFVIDRQRRVRDLRRSPLPSSGFVTLAADALALPTHDATVPTSR